MQGVHLCARPKDLVEQVKDCYWDHIGPGDQPSYRPPLPRLVSLGSERPCQALAIATHLPPSVAIYRYYTCTKRGSVYLLKYMQ